MPDISMCADESCPSKMQCYRYFVNLAEPGETYTVHDFGAVRQGDKCDSFIPNEDTAGEQDSPAAQE